MFKSIPVGATLGVLGGGQLGMMFIEAAHERGYRVVVVDPDPQAPARRIADGFIHAQYDDQKALDEIAASSSAITTEFENVPATSLSFFERRGIRVCPPSEAIRSTQDRRIEKKFFQSIGVPVGPYQVIESEEEISKTNSELFPGVLKTACAGYDGKGQVRVSERADLREAFNSLGRVPCVLEKRLELQMELSVVVARGSLGNTVIFPVFENHHDQGILDFTICPARCEPERIKQVSDFASKIAQELHYEGVLCVEFFVVKTNSGVQIFANEMAPRPHNSGHLTREACDYSQFDAQVRTLCGLKLEHPGLKSPAVMVNLLGKHLEHSEMIEEFCKKEQKAFLKIYGKTRSLPGRKMGHLTVLGDTVEAALKLATEIRSVGV